jgi:inorganic phosphate transporter, PiT family
VATLILIVAVFFLAWSNGANDNFKGVATLYGSRTLTFRQSIWLTTGVTLAGSILSLVLASALAKAFTGKGLVPPEIAGTSEFLISVGLAAALTIMLATVIGMPTSTTHALTGALLGVAIVIGVDAANYAKLWDKFFLPLLVSPILALGAALIFYPILTRTRKKMGVGRQTCLCVGTSPREYVPLANSRTDISTVGESTQSLEVSVGSGAECVERYDGRVVGINAQQAVDVIHTFSGAAVCFARGVNDTPKIAALLLATGGAGLIGGTGISWKLALVALAMAAGGFLQARKVAETMSHRIADLNTGQGLTGNLITAALVLGASRFGVPVSTTHVSCGAIFGIGVASGGARLKTIGQIVLTWVTTLPLGAALGAALYWSMT